MVKSDSCWPTGSAGRGSETSVVAIGLSCATNVTTVFYLYETLTEQRREHSVGDGIYLSSVHRAKGRKFERVFTLKDGGAAGRRIHETAGLIVRYREDSEESFRISCLCDRWEAPWLEARYRRELKQSA